MSATKVIWCDRGWMPAHYGFCPSEAAWRREMKRMNVTGVWPSYPTTAGHTFHFDKSDGSLWILVTISEKIDKTRDRIGIVALIVHEAAHVWQAIRRDAGEKDPSPEFEAYALQSITIQLCVAYSKTRWKLT